MRRRHAMHFVVALSLGVALMLAATAGRTATLGVVFMLSPLSTLAMEWRAFTGGRH